MTKRKGSLTVEAIISFTVFIGVSFLLLTLVKLVLVMTILNNAAVETAKTIATAAYPISILNEMQAGMEAKIENTDPATLEESTKATIASSVTTQLLGGNGLKAAKGSAAETLKGLIEGIAVNAVQDMVYSIKGQAVNALCGMVVQGYIENCGIYIAPEKLMLRAAKIPETEAEFEKLHSDPMPLSETGTLTASPAESAYGTDGNFNADDVLICLEYPYEIALPLIPAVTVTLRSVAVEHAWLHGTSSGPSRKEGIQISNLLFGKGTVVYVPTGGYGKRYHQENCSTLWSSKAPMSLAAAKNQGLTPCRVCKPPEK